LFLERGEENAGEDAQPFLPTRISSVGRRRFDLVIHNQPSSFTKEIKPL
jgi:hypothetical protein